ncbi:unnamed protein product, partial [Nesidiocoris tenuis]
MRRRETERERRRDRERECATLWSLSRRRRSKSRYLQNIVGGHTKATQRQKKKPNLNQKGMDKVGGSELDAFFDPSSTTGPREPSPAPPPPVELPKELTNQSTTLITMSAAVANNNNDISKAAPPADAPPKSKDAPKEQRIQPSESAASDKSAAPNVAEDAEQPEKGAAEAAEAEAKSSDSEKEEKSEEGAAAVEVLAEENGAASPQATGPALPPYSYKDGQWTPLNTDGRKVYDREFLLEIKNSTYALTKPDFKQELDIFRDKPNDSLPLNHRGMKMGGDRRGPGRGMAILSGSQSGGGMGRMGGGKGGFGMGGPIGGYGIPAREEPQLHRDPGGGWKPSFLAKRPADLDEEAEKLDRLDASPRGKQSENVRPNRPGRGSRILRVDGDDAAKSRRRQQQHGQGATADDTRRSTRRTYLWAEAPNSNTGTWGLTRPNGPARSTRREVASSLRRTIGSPFSTTGPPAALPTAAAHLPWGPSSRGGSQPLDNRERSEPRIPGPSGAEDVSNLDEEKAKITSDFIFDEWCINYDVNETLLTMQEKLGNQFNACLFIENILGRVLERTSELNKFGPLLVAMINDKKPLISLDDIVN